MFKLFDADFVINKSENIGHAGYVPRMEDTRLPKKISFGTVARGKEKVQENQRRTGLTVLKRTVYGQTPFGSQKK
jgi:hypothetical protein